MKEKTLITFCVIILNGLVAIGMGHGFAFLFLIEANRFPDFLNIHLSDFSFSANSEQSLLVASFLSMLGQLILFFSFLIIDNRKKSLVQITGLLFLWSGFMYLSLPYFSSGAYILLLPTAIPFLILSGISFFKIVKHIIVLFQHNTSKNILSN